MLAADNSAVVNELLRLKSNTIKFGAAMFPERFFRPSDLGHYEIQRILDSNHNKIVILAPRSIGKTALIKTNIQKKLAFREARNFIFISKTQGHSMEQTESIKDGLLKREIIKLFGRFEPHGRELPWSMKKWATNFGQIVQALGGGQQVRGLNHNDIRPDYVVCDDMEDEEIVKNEERRMGLYRWFMDALMGVFDKAHPFNRIVVIGTPQHDDSLLMNLYRNPDWTSVKLQLCDPELLEKGIFKSNFPNYLSDQQIEESYNEAVRAGNIDGWYQENMCELRGNESIMFSRESFRYFEGDVPPGSETVILIDPAKSTGERSADFAIIVASVNTRLRRVYVHEATGGQFHVKQAIDIILGYVEEYDPKAIGVEVTGLNMFITEPLRDALAARGKFIRPTELQAKGEKRDRVGALDYYYNNGQVYHNRPKCLRLEGQLLSYPYSKKWDLMDALAHIITLKAEGGRLWEDDSDEDDTKTQLDEIRELDSIEYEEVNQEDYRLL